MEAEKGETEGGEQSRLTGEANSEEVIGTGINLMINQINQSIERSGITKSSIAKDIGVSPQQFSNALHGRRPFPLKWIGALCERLHCDPNALLGWKDNQKMRYLSDDFSKLVVLDTKTGNEIAVVTNELITTADTNFVVKLTPTDN